MKHFKRMCVKAHRFNMMGLKNKELKNTFFLVLQIAALACFSQSGNAAEASSFAHIRQLAASCAACHGEQGNSVAATSDEGANAVLAGVNSAEFVDKMMGFKEGSRKATVMHHHAKGLTVEEIKQLSIYFSQQKRMTKAPLTSQTLRADHE